MMVNPVQKVKNQIIDLIRQAVSKAVAEGELSGIQPEDISVSEVIIEVPRDKQHGDFATNFAMQITKVVKKPPRTVAEILISKFCFDDTYVEKAELAGPGFINFFIAKDWLVSVMSVIEEASADFGRVDVGNGEKVMVEFISANPTGPMHMGNARGGALGDCLASVLDWAGFDVTREFYINDAGNQIEKFATSLEARYIQLLKGEAAFEFPEDGYHGEDIVERAHEFIQIEGDKHLEVDSEERKNALVHYALNKNIEKIKEDLKSYGIEYDVWFNESSLYESGEVDETIDFLKSNGYTVERDDALWFKASEFGAEKDEVLVRNNGVPTYFAADIAYHRNKFKTRGFDKVIDIWGADHHGHVARMKGAMEAVGCDASKLDVIIMQLVRLLRDGEVARMSKRTGRAVTLSDLLEETGKDAARFFFNLRQAGSHLDFDLDLAVSKSDENPVFYVQYAHARICSIINQLEEEGIFVPNVDDTNILRLVEPEEIELIKKLAQLPEEIKSAALALEPSKITRYILDLAQLFHSFYSACRVKVEDRELMLARLKLIDSVRLVMRNILNILSVSAPEKM